MTKRSIIDFSEVSHYYSRYKLFGGIFERVKSLAVSKSEAVQSLFNISFSVEEGICCGLLGANGAGKTTIIKLLCGLMQPASGTISLLGFSPQKRNKEMLKRIGVLFGNRGQLVWDLPPSDTWELLGVSFGLSVKETRKVFYPLAERLGVLDKISTPVRKLSLGERMKCELICSILHKPEVLILDEPTIGLDIKSQNEIRRIISEEKKNGVTVVLTSHYMQDIEAAADFIVLLKNGNIEYNGSVSKLIEKYKPGYIFQSNEDFYIPGIGVAENIGGRWILEIPQSRHNILNTLDFSKLPADFSFGRFTLEEAILGIQEESYTEDDDD